MPFRTGDGHRAPRGAPRPPAGRVDRRRAGAYVLTQLTGPVAVGDRVVLNTTAVELGLGTGGWHVVHWNLGPRRAGRAGSRPHHEAALHEPPGRRRAPPRSTTPTSPRSDLDGMPVVVVQPPQPGARRSRWPSGPRCPTARLAYVMTDGAALPLALSDLVADMVARRAARRHDHRRPRLRRRPRGRLGALRPRPGPSRRGTPTSRSSPWVRASSAPARRSAPPPSRWPPSSTRAAALGGQPDRRRCGCRAATSGSATAG